MRSGQPGPRVLLFDLWATVPYYTAYLALALRAAGVAVEIASITYYLDRDCFRSRGLRLNPGLLDVVGHVSLPRTARRLLKLVEGCVNLLALTVRALVRPPEILHVQFLTLLRTRLPLDLYFIRLCRLRGTRIVLTVHDLLPHDTGVRYLALYRNLYREVDALICHSAPVRDRLVAEFGVATETISVIPHGPFFYDLPNREPEQARALAVGKPKQKIVLWQGIVFPYKGVDLLLNAWREVEQTVDDAVLVILGTGDSALLAALQSQAAMLGLRRVCFELRFCSTEELVLAYREASVVVYPYRAITTSGALATGLALGKAVVASDLEVFREALVQGETGLLVDSEQPLELAGAICRLLLDDNARERLESNVRSLRFGDNSWRYIGEETRALYERLLPLHTLSR